MSTSLKALAADWADRGIETSIYEDGEIITLAKIRVPAAARGDGLGSAAMRELTDYADATSQIIAATPSTDFGGSSVARLVDFYRRFGFTDNKGRRRDFRTRETMIREPAAKRNPAPPPLWLEYRLDRLEFQGGQSITFGGDCRMLYNPTDHVIAVECPAAVRSRVAKLFPISGPPGRTEIKRIEYAMIVNLPAEHGRPPVRRTLQFFHPLRRGAGVRVQFNDRGELFFLNESGRPLFSKDYTLRDVSRGEIDSDRAVWQFQGYKHEH